MQIAISGATGFIGKPLSQYLEEQGHTVLPLERNMFRDDNADWLAGTVQASDVVINLAGAPIDHRWSKAYKRELYTSRVLTTRKLVDAINAGGQTRLLISASAVGYYDTSSCYDEYDARKGDGFLADLCEAWEREVRRVRPGVRLAITRFGVVLAPLGGAFEKMTAPARRGVAAQIGSGAQPFAWIDREDLIRAMALIIDRESLHGVFNFVAPQPLTQRQFTVAVARHYGAKIIFPVPKLMFRVLFGESAQVLVNGQCVAPERLLEAGFRFRSPDIGAFLGSLPPFR